MTLACNMRKGVAVLLLAAMLVSACGDKERPQEKQHPLWQSQLDALERAKQVEDMVKDQAEQRRRQIDEIESKR